MDIDHFKVVNDTYGHLVGDKALRAVTDALRSQLRGYDLAGRFGGEEFVVLLPHAREVDAINVAERLRRTSPGCPSRSTTGTSPPAASGSPSRSAWRPWTAMSRELTDMLAAADAALYHAKETGRNKTHVITATAQASYRLPRPPYPPGRPSGAEPVDGASTRRTGTTVVEP